MRSRILLLAVLASMLFAVSCSSAPTESITAANEAFQRASTPVVEEYAPESLASARVLITEMNTELQTQENKIGFLRSYDKTAELAASAKQASEKAVTDAESGRETARNDAATAISAAQSLLDETRTLLKEAPAGKGTQSDMALFKSDLDGVEMTLADAQSAYDSGRFREAGSKAESARQATEQVKMQLDNAAETRRKAGGPRA